MNGIFRPPPILGLLVGLTLYLVSTGYAFADSRLTLAVLDLKDDGAGAETARNVGQAISAELGSLGPFNVISSADIRQMVSVSISKQVMGCEDAACLAEIGGALGARYVISGTAGKLEGKLLLTLQLLDLKENTVRAREVREIGADAMNDARQAARSVVRSLLEAQTGHLVIRLNEEGANIKINDKLTAVSPAPRLPVPSGPHRVSVNKEGFVHWAKDITVSPDETTVADVVLVPSLEFVEKYESSAQISRIAAWSLTGLGLVATGTGLGLLLNQSDRRSRLGRDIQDFNRGEASSDVTQAGLERRIDSVEREYRTYQIVGYAGIGMLGAALYFWLAGDPPGKYQEFRGGNGFDAGAVLTADGATGWLGSSF